MNRNKTFSLPPSMDKKVDEFIDQPKQSEISTNKQQKGGTKVLTLRIPETLHRDLQTAVVLSGISMNAIAINLLRPGVRGLIKQLQEECQ